MANEILTNINNDIKLTVEAAESLTYANYQAECEIKRFSSNKRQNSFSFLRKVSIQNNGKEDILDASIQFSFEPSFIKVSPILLTCLEKGKLTEADSFDVSIDVGALYSINEKVPASVTVNVLNSSKQIIATKIVPFSLLPIQESAASPFVEEILASFVTPNDDEVKKVIGEASLILKEKYGTTSFAAYQYHDPNKVIEQLDAIYLALAKEGIRYSEPPASFEKVFQRVRLPFEVLKDKAGTCLDFAILYASLVECVGIRPILILVSGHAFVGAWLDEETTLSSKIDNGSELLTLASKGYNRAFLINCVGASASPSINFLQAGEEGYKCLESTKRFLFALDIASCRREHLLPIPTPHVLEDGSRRVAFPFDEKDEKYEVPEVDLSARRYVDSSDKAERTKFDYWEEKLLDLSMRNRLINLRFPPTGIQLMVSDAEGAVSFLSSSNKVSLVPFAIPLNAQEKGYGVLDFQPSEYSSSINEAKKKKSILVTSKTGDVESSFKNLSRKANTAMEESGCNPLFLTLGLIKWFDNEKAASHGTGAIYSPIFLLPVRMPRRKSGPLYTMEYSFEDFSLNTTIIEYFQETFHLDFSSINGVLRKTDDGIPDVRIVYNLIREKIADMKGWALLEEPSTISLFSFSHFVMWNDMKTNREKMMENSIVSSLVSGEAHWETPDGLIEKEKLDSELSPTSLAIPLPADSSQIDAIASSDAGASFILDGPPGTGKSQTIANMITNFLYHGKSVLFVAEKAVALEVVKRRLDSLGLGQFCLEIPSVMTAKSDVLSSLGSLLDLGPTEGPKDFEKEAEIIEKEKEELNSTLKKLHGKGSYFISAYEAIIGYLSLEEYKDRYDTSDEYAKKLSEEKFLEAKKALEKLAAEDSLNHGYWHNPFLPFFSETYDLEERESAFKDLLPLVESLRDFHREIYNCFFKEKAFAETRENVLAYLEILSILRENQHVEKEWFGNDEFTKSSEELRSYLEISLQISLARERLLSSYSEGVFDLPSLELLNKAKSLSSLSLFKRQKVWRSITKSFKPLGKSRTSLHKKAILSAIDELASIDEKRKALSAFSPFVRHVYEGRNLDDTKFCQSALDSLERTLKINPLIASMVPSRGSSSDDLSSAFGRLATDSSILFDKAHSTLVSHSEELRSFLSSMREKHSFDLSLYPDTFDFYEKAASSLQDAINSKGNLAEWVKLLNCIKEAKNLVPSSLIYLYQNGTIGGNELLPTYLCSLYFRILNGSLSETGLASLSAKDTDSQVAFYKGKMEEFARLSVVETAMRITSSYPNNSENYASSTLPYKLRKLAKNGGRGTSIRRLLSDYGDLVHTLCPCFLMSPSSVAQYLDINAFKFDVVVFDEASQIPTSEAIGAIARGKSVVIAGDQEQMPPTSFFTSQVGASLDEEPQSVFDADLESLLDDVIVLGLPRKRLTWHYRSHHESLIAFSNSKFYDNSLLTFPSPTSELASVSFREVNGLYEQRRGVNRKEASEIVAEIKRRLKDPVLSKKSIGVVTFNEAQQNLIEDYLDKELSKEDLDKAPGGETIFVKNLENVQGDERDVILFSVTYGRSEKNGAVALRFGPLSLEKGERRLNVAVSRARDEMIVFSSILPSDIRAEKAKNAGASYLRDFLRFAQSGVSSLANNASSLLTVSHTSVADFIAKDLIKLGFGVEMNIGASSFKIDLAIKDPEKQDHYLLGVICDGDSYCAPLTCRDRNLVQPSILTALGWKLFRVWSVEYLDHPLEVVKGIVAAINAAKDPICETKKDNGTIPQFSKKEVVAHPHATNYVLAPASSISLDFDSPFAVITVQNWIERLLEIESPISRHMLEARFRETFNVRHIGSTMANVLQLAIIQLSPLTESCGSMDFYWKKGSIIEEYRFYRLNSPDFYREISDISYIELGNAFADILTVQGRMSDVDLYKQVSLLFGFQSLKEKSRLYLSKALKSNSSNRLGIMMEDGMAFVK